MACFLFNSIQLFILRVPGRTTWTHMSFCQELIVLQGTCIWSLDTYFNLLPIYHLYVCLFFISYQARVCLQISYPAILFTMLLGFLNCGSFIVRALLPGEQAQRSHCQFSCWAHAFTSFCRAHNGIFWLTWQDLFWIWIPSQPQWYPEQCHISWLWSRHKREKKNIKKKLEIQYHIRTHNKAYMQSIIVHDYKSLSMY